MGNKPSNHGRMAPLQEVELVPITDPAKQAALERQRRQAKDAEAVVQPRRGRFGTRKTARSGKPPGRRRNQ